MKVNPEVYVLLEEQTVLILRMRMIFHLFLCFILHPLDNPSKESVGIWANEFTSLFPLKTTEELAWITGTFLPNSRFPKCGRFKAERSPESLWNDLGPSQLLTQQVVVPFSQGSPSDALPYLLSAPSHKGVMGGRWKTDKEHN